MVSGRRVAGPHLAARSRAAAAARAEARILRRDGTQVNARPERTPRLSSQRSTPTTTPACGDRVPGARDGDLVELAWVLSETASPRHRPYKGGLLEIGHQVAVGLSEVELSGRRSCCRRGTSGTSKASPSGSWKAMGSCVCAGSGETCRRCRRTCRPPAAANGPHLVYSNHPRWGDLATLVRSATIASRVRASRQVEDTARRLTEVSATASTDRATTASSPPHRLLGLDFGEHRTAVLG